MDELARLRARVTLLERLADRRRRVDPQRIAVLHGQGLSDGQIARRFGVTAGAILYWRRKLKLETTR